MLPEKFHETLEAVLYVALHSGATPVSGKAICTYQKAAPRHLEPVLQALVRNNILHGSKGPKGGYSLARERRRITLAEIMQASLKPTSDTPTSTLHTKIVQPYVTSIETVFLEILNQTTLEDLCQHANDVIEPVEKSDFNI